MVYIVDSKMSQKTKQKQKDPKTMAMMCGSVLGKLGAAGSVRAPGEPEIWSETTISKAVWMWQGEEN